MGRARWLGMTCALLLACSGDENSAGGRRPNAACSSADARCGQQCSATQSCPFGFYCSAAGMCAKDCDPAHPCADGETCGADGMCVSAGGGTAGGGAGAGGTGGSGGSRPGTCADKTVSTSRTTPTVILIVDQSSSMEEDFGGDGTRWDVLRDFLLDEPDGLIASLDSQVNFGLALYSAVSGGSSPTPIGECPMVTTVAPAANNYAAIAQVYRDAEPIEDTPTGDSIDRVIDDLDLGMDPDAQRDPIVFVLATDGEPDRCEQLDPQNGQAETIAAVERAFSLGIRTFIISVGDEVSERHQQDVANAGLGRKPGDPDAEYWRAGDDQSLREALTSIVSGQIGCEIALNGEVTSGDPCNGTVELNGVPLACNDEDGWELLDPTHIRLLGDACDELKSGDAVLEVTFPCSVGVVF